jgi:hypothetical protein
VDRIKKCGVEAYRKATTVGLALLAGNGKLKVKMVLTGEGTGLTMWLKVRSICRRAVIDRFRTNYPSRKRAIRLVV